MSVENKYLEIQLISHGTFIAELPRVNAPLSISRLYKELPIKARGLKQGTRIVVPNILATKKEHPQTTFSRGDISVEPSSGNLSIHLEDGQVDHPENLLGSITSEFTLSSTMISVGILIQESVSSD